MDVVEIDDFKLYRGDCLSILPTLAAGSIDAVITDPPYELGFMGKEWDKTGITYNIGVWQEVLRVLKPGGHLLSFGGSRTYHRIACAIEDAGFEIRDQIMWVYGSGFPKSLNIGKAVDKLQGNEREVVGISLNDRPKSQVASGMGFDRALDNGQEHKTICLTQGTSEWEGWGTGLKPAHEPIVVARKPLSKKTVAENVLKWGTGGLNIDECRIPTNGESLSGGSTTGSHGAHEGWRRPWMDNPEHNARAAEASKERVAKAEVIGRFPANFIHDGSDEVVGLFPMTTSGGGNKANILPKNRNSQVPSATNGGNWEVNSGSAARFFYCAKASQSEREDDNNHPTVKPIALMEYLIRLVSRKEIVILDPFMGSGTTGVACAQTGRRFIGVEIDQTYFDIAVTRIRKAKQQLRMDI